MNKKIKILFILPQQKMGGAEMQMINLLENIDKKLFKVYLGVIYSSKDLEAEFRRIKDIDLVFFNKRGKFDLTIFFKIARFTKKENIDLIQTFLSNHHAYLPVFIGGRGIPVGGIRSTYIGSGSFIDKIFRFDLTRLASKLKKMYLIANSYHGKAIYVRHNFPKEKIFVIPNGINVDKFSKGNSKNIIKEFGLRNKIVLGVVSRIDERKNHRELLNIFYDLQKKFDNLVLFIIGDGPYLPALKKIVEEEKMQSKVIFTGMRKDIPDFLKSMDIFVFPSKFPEGWPNAVGEAMCSGVPVVSYPCGDVRYIITDKYDGIISEPDEDSFRKNVIYLIRNKDYRNRLSSNAKKTILNKFTIPIMVKKYENAYRDIIQKG